MGYFRPAWRNLFSQCCYQRPSHPRRRAHAPDLARLWSRFSQGYLKHCKQAGLSELAFESSSSDSAHTNMRLQARQFRGPGHLASMISPKEVRKGEAEQRLPGFIAKPFGCSSYEACSGDPPPSNSTCWCMSCPWPSCCDRGPLAGARVRPKPQEYDLAK